MSQLSPKASKLTSKTTSERQNGVLKTSILGGRRQGAKPFIYIYIYNEGARVLLNYPRRRRGILGMTVHKNNCLLARREISLENNSKK